LLLVSGEPVLDRVAVVVLEKVRSFIGQTSGTQPLYIEPPLLTYLGVGIIGLWGGGVDLGDDGLSGVGELGLGIGHGLEVGLGGVGELGLGVGDGSSCVLNCPGGTAGNSQNGQERESLGK
jgi:hypothetical protein